MCWLGFEGCWLFDCQRLVLEGDQNFLGQGQSSNQVTKVEPLFANVLRYSELRHRLFAD